MEYMIANGVSSSRLRAKGYGDTRPHESNASEKGRALNRRVELHPYR
jgi:OOP family OmpA-OmpF porin